MASCRQKKEKRCESSKVLQYLFISINSPKKITNHDLKHHDSTALVRAPRGENWGTALQSLARSSSGEPEQEGGSMNQTRNRKTKNTEKNRKRNHEEQPNYDSSKSRLEMEKKHSGFS